MPYDDYSGLKQNKKQRDIPSQNTDMNQAAKSKSPWENAMEKLGYQNPGEKPEIKKKLDQ